MDSTKSDSDVEPLPLSALNGATLTWEKPNGETVTVEFEDHS